MSDFVVLDGGAPPTSCARESRRVAELEISAQVSLHDDAGSGRCRCHPHRGTRDEVVLVNDPVDMSVALGRTETGAPERPNHPTPTEKPR